MEELIRPLGIHVAIVWKNPKRVTFPLLKYKAEKVYLVSQKEDGFKNLSKPCAEEIKHELRGKGIQIIEDEKCEDMTDLFENIRTLRRIIEKEQGRVAVNISSGGTMAAIASLMACMMFGAEAYYVKPKDYQHYSKGYEKVLKMPTYRITVPEQRLIEALKVLKKNGGSMRKKDFKEALFAKGILTLERTYDIKEPSRTRGRKPVLSEDERKEINKMRAAKNMKLNQNIIEPLKNEWKCIDETREKRPTVRLLPVGDEILKFMG